MPTRDEMLKVIYEKIADKVLWFWCRLNSWDIIISYCIESTDKRDDGKYKTIYWSYKTKEEILSMWIVWCPVMIGDVLDWFYKNHWKKDNFLSTVIYKWTKLRLSIDHQPIECIEYIYNLCK